MALCVHLAGLWVSGNWLDTDFSHMLDVTVLGLEIWSLQRTWVWFPTSM